MAEGVRSGLRRAHAGAIALGAIISSAVAFIIFSAVDVATAAVVDVAPGRQFSCTVQSVYDGDGPINCAEIDQSGKQVVLRLRGIEAREADDTCRRQDICPNATGAAGKEQLTRLAVGRLECTSFGPSYNSVDVFCRNAAGIDISCEMIRSGAAARWPEYDPDGRLLPCVPQRR